MPEWLLAVGQVRKGTRGQGNLDLAAGASLVQPSLLASQVSTRPGCVSPLRVIFKGGLSSSTIIPK